MILLAIMADVSKAFYTQPVKSKSILLTAKYPSVDKIIYCLCILKGVRVTKISPLILRFDSEFLLNEVLHHWVSLLMANPIVWKFSSYIKTLQ